MELRQLRYFAAIARQPHFTRAAAGLGVATLPRSEATLVVTPLVSRDLNSRTLARTVALAREGDRYQSATVAVLITLARDALRRRRETP